MADWSARTLPAMRARMATDYDAVADRLLARLARAAAGATPALRESVERSAAYHRSTAAQARRADLFWVSADMAALALDASLDVPGFSVGDLPGRVGLAAFGGPLPALELPPIWLEGGIEWRGAVPVWGVMWHGRDLDTVAVDVITRRADLPHPMVGEGQLQPVFTVLVPRAGGMVFDDVGRVAYRSRPGEALQDVGREHLGVLAFVSAMSHMMMRPTLAERRTLDARTGRGEAPQSRPGDLVSVIDLRPLRYVQTGERSESGRVYTHRWLVRGHWTHQPYGPGQSLRKLVYREPYIKGPEGARLLATEKVMVWRR